MGKSDGRWVSVGAHVFHAIGASWYIYQWLIIGGAAGLAAGIISYILTSWVISAVVVGILSLFVLACGLLIFTANVRRRFRSANPGLKFLNTKVTYRKINDAEYEYVRVMDAQAAYTGVSTYNHRFSWTGQGSIVASPIDARDRVELSDDQSTYRKVVRIFFHRQRARRDEGGLTRHIQRSGYWQPACHAGTSGSG